jgi:hypothetical protein
MPSIISAVTGLNSICLSTMLLQAILERAKASIDGPITWADLYQLAGAEAVALTGGPQIKVRPIHLRGVCEAELCFLVSFT